MDSLSTILKYRTTYDRTLLAYSTIVLILPPVLLVINAPYGRFTSKNVLLGFGFSRKWSKLAWFTMEMVSPIVYTLTVYLLAYDSSNAARQYGLTTAQKCLSALWYIHYTNRTLIYTYRVPSMASMGLLTWLSAIVFNSVNGYINAYWVATQCCNIDGGMVTNGIGLCLWTAGFISNIYHDSILFSLRKGKSGGYSIPKGGLYRFVSCPNYLSECVEWIGYALLCRSPPSFWFAVGTMSNLIPRAYKSHQWYKQRFKDYPTNRRAVIPFIL
ncbi:3-oxo-5-alpha-steroid 4-dehydrogenase-domain-containing protein [Absidia repens]|uniref:3-oxo-5-alpha-steroid 4-dehydrogenase-domain-containing protein n=1 Tax=Absidia repens TaxID=90262 RepID=A0A1X2ILZ9_9FUNG|nr:3-oxo-5-alpha-steroid 4-dehydrogenase-domain-containing protein [Absidia repens]